MEIVNTIVGVVGCLIDPVKRELGYMFSYKRNVGKVKEKNDRLKNTKRDVETQVERNKGGNVYIPAGVPGWLKKAEAINTLVGNFPSDVGGCSLKIRHDIGKKALEIIDDIDGLIDEQSRFDWNGPRIPPGEVGSMKASTSTPSSHPHEFESREQTFLEALKALESGHKSHMVALCGMGGVGKTTMMEKLKKAVTERKQFDFIVLVTVGEKTNTYAIQQAVSVFLGENLRAEDKATRACELHRYFEARSAQGKKFLVVLDDVWEFVDLTDIGLSPLPNQGVGFKILLTSRDRHVCIEMGVELNSVLDVELLTDQEAKSFFFQFARNSEDVDLDLDLRNIGDEIANRCQGLPIALKTIARNLKGKRKGVWEDALSSLNHRQFDERLHQIFEISYNNLQEQETRSTLFLCGLFHKEFDTPKEDLVRYGWGLSLFSNVDTIQEARNRLSAHIERLVDANLLIRSEDDNQCVKMHDLVRAFVLRMCSKGAHESIVGNMSKWPTKVTSKSCKRISLTCTSMSEFPRDRKYPNLLLLRLVHGKGSLQFHDDFYQEMGKLKVLAYERMACQMTLTSLRCSINLRTLCFDRCFSTIDFTPIGDLFNLEVLSITNCHMQRLPSAIGNLRKLKLLDLKGTTPCIEDGVLKNLVELEELYMKHAEHIGPAEARYIHVNGDELATCSKNLVALEIEFDDNKALPKGMSFKKLKRFKISFGCPLGAIRTELGNRFSVESILWLEARKYQLLELDINELLIKTEMLHFQVNDVRDGLLESLYPHHSSFYNLKVLDIGMCVELRYLFTIGVANGLTRLECLQVSSCPVLERLLDTENSGVEVIIFESLKFLRLCELPKLTSFCNNVNVIELPQLEELELYTLPNFTSIYPDNKPTSSMSNETSAIHPLLNKEIVIPRLKKIKMYEMQNLKEIWPSNNGEVRLSLLKEIEIIQCESLVNLFPSNPMSSLLQHLEELTVMLCGSIDVLFNIDLGHVGEIEELINRKLKSIKLSSLENLTEIWRVTGENGSTRCIMRFEALEKIEIFECKSLNRAFPSSIKFDMAVIDDSEEVSEYEIALSTVSNNPYDDNLQFKGRVGGVEVKSIETIGVVDAFVGENLST